MPGNAAAETGRREPDGQGAEGCGCPERPYPCYGNHAERRERSKRTRADPPFGAACAV